MAKIKIRESSAYIADLDIHSSSVMDYFRTIPPAQLESAFMRALEVGAFCLERSNSSQQICEALDQGICKGKRYEDDVVRLLQSWTRVTGALVHHVGADNLPGDILVELATHDRNDPMRVVVEVRDRRAPKGRRAVSALLARAISARSANAAIYLSRTAEGLANELGEWAEGECSGGPFVTCTHEHLTTALRFLHTRKRIAELQRASAELDGAAIESQLLRIRTSLDRLKNLSRRTNEIRSSTWEIDDEAASLRADIREALTVIEDAVHEKQAKPASVQETQPA